MLLVPVRAGDLRDVVDDVDVVVDRLVLIIPGRRLGTSLLLLFLLVRLIIGLIRFRVELRVQLASLGHDGWLLVALTRGPRLRLRGAM